MYLITGVLMSYVVVTSCSSRKAIPKERRVAADALQEGQLKDVASQWIRMLAQHSTNVCCGQLYQGRGVQEIKKAASELESPVWFISAGLGLVNIDQTIPAYNLTVSKGNSDFVGDKIVTLPFNSYLWWREINRLRGNITLNSLISAHNDKLFLLALPSNYFDMIAPELMMLTDSELGRVRLFGPPKSKVDERFHSILMPYDNRLNGPDSPLRGTYSDFSQRALHHFVSILDSKLPLRTPDSDTALVSASLTRMRLPSVIKRAKVTDDEIKRILQRNWSQCAGKPSRLLRLLRDVELTACEQKRFSRIFDSVNKLMSDNYGR